MTITQNVASKLVVGFVAASMLFTLSFAPAKAATTSTSSDLQAQITALLAQIAALQGHTGQGGQSVGSGICPFTWNMNLKMGSKGDDVKKLQMFLNADVETRVAAAGPGSVGSETMSFGPMTRAAVSKFQTKYRADILTPAGLVSATGMFGPASRAKANMLCTTVPVAPTPTTGDDTTTTTGDDTTTSTHLSGGEASLSNFDARSGADTNVNEGQVDAPVMDVRFDVKDGDAQVTRLDVGVTRTAGTETHPWKVFKEISIMNGGKEVARVDSTNKDDWEKDTPNTGDYRFRVTGLKNVVIKHGETAKMTVQVTVETSIQGDTGTWNFFVPNTSASDGIRTTDGLGINQYTGKTSDTISVDIKKQGNDDELIIKTSSSNPSATTLQLFKNKRSGWTKVFVYDLDTRNSTNNVQVDTLKIPVVVSQSTYTAVVGDARIRVDGKDIGTLVTTNGGTATATLTFTFKSGEFVITKGNRGSVELDLDFNQLPTLNEGMTLYASTSISGLTAESDNDLTGSQLSGAAIGKTHTLRTEGAIVASTAKVVPVAVEHDPASTSDNEGTFVVKFDVTAFQNDVYVAKSAVRGTVMGTQGVNYTILDATAGGVATTSGAVTSATLTSTADTADSNSGFFKVNQGETKTFTLTVTFNPSLSSSYQLQVNSLNFATTGAVAPTTQQNTLPAESYQTDPLQVVN